MAFLGNLPNRRENEIQCYYCGKWFGYENFQSHDKERCKKENDNFAIENKRQQPMFYYAKTTSYWKFQYSVEPKKVDNTCKPMCSCDEEHIYPVMMKDFKYWFNSSQLTKILFNYWCGNCGLELTQKQREQWFSKYDFTKIQEENRIKSTWY